MNVININITAVKEIPQIHIVSNEKITDADEMAKNRLSFEQLLLAQLKQNSANTGTKGRMKLTRVAQGSDVITRASIEKQKNEYSANIPQTNGNDFDKPGPSGIKKFKKDENAKKRRTTMKIVIIPIIMIETQIFNR